MQRILTSTDETVLAEARDVLSRLATVLAEFGATDDLDTLTRSSRQLDDVFLLVVAGEFNAGKSALINALIGTAVLTEGVVPTTAQLHMLAYGESTSTVALPDGMRLVTAPVELLRDLHIVDTPGTNAILREHERLTTDFVPRSDMVLFVTSADRPFTETERQFLEQLRDWGKKIAILVNKIDLVTTPGERDEVLTFVAHGATALLGVEPPVIGVSARLAMRAKRGEPALWPASGFDRLEALVQETLQPEVRFRVKLANPLGVARALVARYSAAARERLALLRSDLELLTDLRRQTSLYDGDLQRGFQLRLESIEKVLSDMERRGDRYFDSTLRIGRVVDLLNRARVQKEFTEMVVADVPQQIERRVSEMIDWLVDQDLRHWQAITTALSGRQREIGGRMLGAPDIGTFHNDRARLLETAGREAQRAVETYDKQHEAGLIADQARVAVAAAAATGGAALGLGTLVTIAASTVAADVTGILLASLVLGVGFLIIPARRRSATQLLGQKLTALAERLRASLTAEFEHARQRSAMRLADAVAPYARFVTAEESRWTEALQALQALDARIRVLLPAGDSRDDAPARGPQKA